MVLVQIWPFFQHFFQALQVMKMTFSIFQIDKKAFLGNKVINTRSSKSRKIDIYPRWLTHGFGQNMAIFPILFFLAILVRKMIFTIFQNEKTLFLAIKTKCSKGRKIKVVPKGLTHGFGPNMAIFPIFFFRHYRLGKMTFTIFQIENTSLQAIKTRSSKSRKIDIYPRWLTHGFGQNMAIFPILFFLAILVRKMTFTTFQNEKTLFLAIKTNKFKMSKN